MHSLCNKIIEEIPHFIRQILIVIEIQIIHFRSIAQGNQMLKPPPWAVHGQMNNILKGDMQIEYFKPQSLGS